MSGCSFPPVVLQTELDHTDADSIVHEGDHPAALVGAVQAIEATTTMGWHRHAACEIHIVVGGSGLAFVGDWIGSFGPGQVVLTGPHLPHRWWWFDEPMGGSDARQRVIRFAYEPLALAGHSIAELLEFSPLLIRARQGIEFFGFAERATIHALRIQESHGLRRFGHFCRLMAELSSWTDHRALSTSPARNGEDSEALLRIDATMLTPADRLFQPVAAADCAADLGMSESRFSRCFRRNTGRTFTDFVSRVRIHRAAQLLLHSDRPVAHICKEVGMRGVAGFNRRFFEIKGTTPSEFRRQAGLHRGRSD